MTAYGTTRRVAAAMVLMALVVLTAPAAMAQTDERRGWEKTSTATGQQESAQIPQPTVVQEPRRGWESTSVATSGSTRVASNPAPATPATGLSVSSILLYSLAVLAALSLAVAIVQAMRPHNPPRPVA